MHKIFILLVLSTLLGSAQSQAQVPPHTITGITPMSHVARGTFEVSVKPLPFEEAGDGVKIGRMSIDKKISGDLTATTKGQMLTAGTDTKGSAGYVAIEYVTGTLSGHEGTFILQHTATMNRGEPSMSITVVPDSGAGELKGLVGDFRINIVDGKHFYEFTYRLDGRSGDD